MVINTYGEKSLKILKKNALGKFTSNTQCFGTQSQNSVAFNGVEEHTFVQSSDVPIHNISLLVIK